MIALVTKKIATAYKLYHTEGYSGVFKVISGYIKVWTAGQLPMLTGYKVNYHGCQFDISNPVISRASRAAIVLGMYEKEEVYAVDTYVNPLQPVIELGAGIGVISCITNKKLKNTDQHIVVEANPALLNTLERNKNLNGCKFQIVHAAVDYGHDKTTFYISDEFIGSSVKSVTSHPVTITTINLKSLLRRLANRPITLICDIEGVEVSLIKQEISEIRDNISTFIIEVHPPFCTDQEISEALDSIRNAGFEHVYNSAWVHIFRNQSDTSQSH